MSSLTIQTVSAQQNILKVVLLLLKPTAYIQVGFK